MVLPRKTMVLPRKTIVLPWKTMVLPRKSMVLPRKTMVLHARKKGGPGGIRASGGEGGEDDFPYIIPQIQGDPAYNMLSQVNSGS